MPTLVTKSQFAAIAGVTKSRVSHWISAGELLPPALVMDGRRELVDVDEAHAQLGDRAVVDQRLVAPAARARRTDSDRRSVQPARGTKPRPDTSRGSTLNDLAREKLTAARLSNERARAEAAASAGRFVEADQARAELGRVAARIVSTVEGSLPELATAIAALGSTSERDALHALRGAWRSIRARLAGAESAAAAPMPGLVEAA